MKARAKPVVVVALGLLLTLVAGWMLMYPSPDPKNLGYVLWKAGIYKLDLRTATDMMVGDPNRSRLVVGRTRAELRRRFGSLIPPAEATPYLRTCYSNSPWKDRDVAFLASSSWMVVFDGNRATQLVLAKGC